MYPTDNSCHDDAVGHVINGVIECFCKRGFYGNGTNCTGIFELVQLTCMFILRKKDLNRNIY